MMASSPGPAQGSPRQNRLLAALPAADLDAMAPHLVLVSLKVGDMLYGPDEQLQHAYFPTTAVVSLHYVTASGASCEVAGVGNEGVVGVSLIMGGETTISSAVVQAAGHAFRLKRHLLKQEFERGAALRRLLLLYTQALMTQVSQAAICTRHHSVDQHMCSWLLLTLDRLPSTELLMTQEQLAGTFGVRRESITAAAGKLQRAGLISCRRGHILVLNRAGLESGACECYSVIKQEISRLLPDARDIH